MTIFKQSLELNELEFHDVLSKEIKWVVDHNRTHSPKTYHNTRHLVKTAALAYFIAKQSKFKKVENFDLPIMMARTMLVHDFHYLGNKDDALNIEHSLDSLDILGYFDLFNNIRLIPELVKLTLYSFDNPYPEPPKNPEHEEAFKIIRDADQLYGTVYFDDTVYDGLYNDIGLRFGLNHEDFITRNVEYIKNIKLYTDIGNQLKESFLKEALNSHETLRYIKRRENERN